MCHKSISLGCSTLFSSKVQKKLDLVADGPPGAIDLLVGVDHLGLLPIDLERIYNLRIQSSPFGPDLLLSSYL